MQITDHIHALKMPFQITDPSGRRIYRFVYAFLIYGETICLIDSGVAGSEKNIVEYLKKTGRSPDEISMLILTHACDPEGVCRDGVPPDAVDPLLAVAGKPSPRFNIAEN